MGINVSEAAREGSRHACAGDEPNTIAPGPTRSRTCRLGSRWGLGRAVRRGELWLAEVDGKPGASYRLGTKFWVFERT
jgi:hypothetical protein